MRPPRERTRTRRDFRSHGLMSLAEVAAAIGVSKQAVEQIERRALRRLRVQLELKGLGLHDLIGEAWQGESSIVGMEDW